MCWVQVPGYGVYTVNIKAGDIIIDNANQYVLVRVPEPELSDFTIDYDNVKLIQVDKKGTFGNPVSIGVDNGIQYLSAAETTIQNKINADQDQYISRYRASTPKKC